MNNEQIPLQQVLDDMYNPNGGPVSWAARDYYYEKYATLEEKANMDRLDKIQTTFSKIMVSVYFLSLLLVLIWYLGGYS